MNAHRIRLPAPWNMESSAEGNRLWHLRRRFQSPTGLTQQSRLTIEVIFPESARPVRVACRLNGHALAGTDSGFDCAQSFFLSTNLLELDLEFDQAVTLELPLVYLVIEE